MFEIVIIIAMIVIVYRKFQRNKQDGSVKGNNSLPNTTVTAPKRDSANTTASAMGETVKQTLLGQSNGNPYGQNRPTSQQRATQSKSAQAAIQEAKEDGNSTTAYLMEKAEADARGHAKEKYEEQKRLYETRGGLAVAERYLDGDTIPQGKKCINCGYCGAENLIPMMPRTKYSCYFCREPL